MTNAVVKSRLGAIQNILISAHKGGSDLSSASKGSEREEFIKLVLSNVIAPPFRIGTGDATDVTGHTTGQLDIVVEYTSSLSFPLLRGDDSRLYLAEGICAIVEVKSDLDSQWNKVLAKADNVAKLTRSTGASLTVGKVPERVPFFAVGYEGWKQGTTVEQKLIDASDEGKVIDGILVIESEIYRGREPDYSAHSLDGPESIAGFLLSIEQLTSSMVGAKPPYLHYFQ